MNTLYNQENESPQSTQRSQRRLCELCDGLLESAYQECLSRELALRQVPFVRQLPLAVMYKGAKVDCAYRVDFLVNDVVVGVRRFIL